jgi:hypothetical protein
MTKCVVSRVLRFTAVLFGTLTTVSCCYLRTPYLLKQLNSGGSAPSEVKRPPIQNRIAKLVRAHVADSYFNPTTVGEWISIAESKPAPLVKQLRCMEQARTDPTKCYRELELSEAPRATAIRRTRRQARHAANHGSFK